MTYDAQTLVDAFAGQGHIRMAKGGLYPQETVDADFVVGKTWVKSLQKYADTKRFRIIYSSKGVHVIPVAIMKGGSLMSFADVLDDAMYARKELAITTKSRGVLIGMPDAVDEFDSDPDRLGYYLAIGEDAVDTVFLDEIVEIKDKETESVLLKAI